MRFALLGDIHANMNALRSVREEICRQTIETVFHVGDIVGYGVDAREVIRHIRENGIKGVMGNHELMVLGRLDSAHCPGKDAIRWTKDNLTTDEIAFLSELPAKYRFGDFVIFHATPDSWDKYLSNHNTAQDVCKILDMEEPGWKVALHGHTHKQRIFVRKPGQAVSLLHEGEGKIKLDFGNQYIICPGSVGVSRDRDPRASLMIFNENTVEQLRIDYDWEACMRKIKREGLKTRLFLTNKNKPLLNRLLSKTKTVIGKVLKR